MTCFFANVDMNVAIILEYRIEKIQSRNLEGLIIEIVNRNIKVRLQLNSSIVVFKAIKLQRTTVCGFFINMNKYKVFHTNRIFFWNLKILLPGKLEFAKLKFEMVSSYYSSNSQIL